MVMQGAPKMTESFFQQVVVLVANRDNAAATTAALLPYVAGTGSSVIAVHIIGRAEKPPDKAPVGQHKQRAEGIFSIVAKGFEGTEIVLETDLRYETDIVASIISAAHDNNASTIVFTPRRGSRWRKLLTGDVTHNPLQSSDIPILVLPDSRGSRRMSATGLSAREQSMSG
jgi:nucleotide-binding universal stress UspA family protein